MLPGALLRNAGLRYICKQVYVRTETANSPFTQALTPGQVLKIPIGHMEGNYFCDTATLGRTGAWGPDCLSLLYPGRTGYLRRQPQWLH